jgi:hypothetical protein
MMTRDMAEGIVEAVLIDLSQRAQCELAIVPPGPLERPYGWVFFYNSREFLETGDTSARLAGNGPVLVAKDDGRVIRFGTAKPLEDYLMEYEKGRELASE